MAKATQTAKFSGRKVLFATPPATIDAKSVGRILDQVMPLHKQNAEATEYLYKVYKGDQEILKRVKTIRPEINNTIVENRAFEVVEFKKGYEFSHPVQYVNAGPEEDTPIDILNTYSRLDGKEAKDVDIAEAMYICGRGYRACYKFINPTEDDAPYYSVVLSPTTTGVVYSTGPAEERLLSFSSSIETDEKNCKHTRTGVYIDKRYFEWLMEGTGPLGGFENTAPVVDNEPRAAGNPIFEYPLNKSRLGYVELCLSLFNAINTLDSNRVDSVEQFVQALLVFVNCELPQDPAFPNDPTKKIIPRTGDVIELKGLQGMSADVKYLIAQLDQSQTQVTKDDLLEAAYEIAGIPSRQARNSGGGDTGQAVVLRNGWGAAEARAKTTEKLFKKAEMEYLKTVLFYCRNTPRYASEVEGLTLRDIDVRFTRNRSDNLLSKAQGLEIMLRSGVNGEDAFETSELFTDPTAVYRKSKQVVEDAQQAATSQQATNQQVNTPSDTASEAGQNSADGETNSTNNTATTANEAV